jgi:hypothetical protein
MKRNLLCAGIFWLLPAFALVFTGCPTEEEAGEGPGPGTLTITEVPEGKGAYFIYGEKTVGATYVCAMAAEPKKDAAGAKERKGVKLAAGTITLHVYLANSTWDSVVAYKESAPVDPMNFIAGPTQTNPANKAIGTATVVFTGGDGTIKYGDIKWNPAP